MKKIFETLVLTAIILFFITVALKADNTKNWILIAQVHNIETDAEIIIVDTFYTKVACEKHAQKIRVFNRNAYFHYNCER